MTGQRLPIQSFSHTFGLCLALGLFVSGCTQVPELNATVPKTLHNTHFPKLIQLDGSLATKTIPQQQSEEIGQAIADRSDRLQARAQALDTVIIDPATRKRMQDGVGH